MQSNFPHSRFLPSLARGQAEPIDQELSNRIVLAVADGTVGSLANKIAFRLGELVRKGAFHVMIEQAVAASDPDSGNEGVIAFLDQAYNALSSELHEINDALRVMESRARERSARTIPLLVRAADLERQKRGELEWLRRQIKEAAANRRQAEEKYRSAGLTDEQIQKLGITPTTLDVEKWDWQTKVVQGELQRLEAFQRDPLCRLTTLQGLPLDAA